MRGADADGSLAPSSNRARMDELSDTLQDACMTPPALPALDFLHARRSVPSRLLREPGPSDEQLTALLHAAVHVPDHGRLAPWRFLRLRGAARALLGELLASRQRERDPGVADAVVEKDRARFNHAPLVLVVIVSRVPGHKIPEQEQLLSAGCVCFSLLQAAQALGFGAQWLTGWAAYDEVIAAHLGLGPQEGIVGFVHIGSSDEPAPERERPDPMTRLIDWTG
jgi:nitroreductase